MPNVGDRVPDFALPNQDGHTLHLSDFLGRRVVIFTFPKAGTMGCTMQACTFRDEFPRLDAANTVILGLSTDTPQELLDWKKKQKLPYDLLSDPTYSVLDVLDAGSSRMFGIIPIRAQRGVWVIDERGLLVDLKLPVGPRESASFALNVLARLSAPASV